MKSLLPSFFSQYLRKKTVASVAAVVLSSGLASAQILVNGTFDGPTGASLIPPGWVNCGGSPDTQIISGTGAGIFGINTPPAHGTAYLGFVSTDYGYIEAAGQPANLTAGTSYLGSIQLYRSTLHANWNGTGTCQIWGGTSCANRLELLWDSGTVTNLNNWQTYPITITPTMNHTYIIIVNNFNLGTGSMDYFCADNLLLDQTILPVSLASFEARDMEHSVRLDWEADDLDGTANFQLDWSTDGFVFEPIGEVPAFADQAVYGFDHMRPVPGVNYYRLSALDANGQTTFTEVRQVEHKANHVSSLYPNPTQNDLSLDIVMEQAGMTEVSVLDATGRIVYHDNREMGVGHNTLRLELDPGLAAGIYQLQVWMGGRSEHHQFMIQK